MSLFISLTLEINDHQDNLLMKEWGPRSINYTTEWTSSLKPEDSMRKSLWLRVERPDDQEFMN